MDEYKFCKFCETPSKDWRIVTGQWMLTDFDGIKRGNAFYICPECQEKFDRAVNKVMRDIYISMMKKEKHCH